MNIHGKPHASNERRTMTLLVQGAAGFVGGTLIPALVCSGFRDLIRIDLKKIPDTLLKKLALDSVRVTTAQTDTLADFLDSEIRIIISLAGQTDVDTALRRPNEALEQNINISIQLAEFIRLNKYNPRLIYLSSDEVLGESFSPLHEDAPLRPTHPYATSKAAAEMILHNYRDVYRLDIVTLRSCNLVGPLQRARKLIPVAVKSLCTSSSVPIFGDGHHRREWMAVEDLCAAVLHIVSGPAKPGVFQASSTVHMSVREVVEIVANALDREARIHTVQDRLVHDKSYSMQTGRLRSLGWKPNVNPRLAIARAARALADPHALDELRFSL